MLLITLYFSVTFFLWHLNCLLFVLNFTFISNCNYYYKNLHYYHQIFGKTNDRGSTNVRNKINCGRNICIRGKNEYESGYRRIFVLSAEFTTKNWRMNVPSFFIGCWQESRYPEIPTKKPHPLRVIIIRKVSWCLVLEILLFFF